MFGRVPSCNFSHHLSCYFYGSEKGCSHKYEYINETKGLRKIFTLSPCKTSWRSKVSYFSNAVNIMQMQSEIQIWTFRQIICWNFPLLLEGNKTDFNPQINHYTKSPLKGKSIKYNCFTYSNLFSVTVAPPDKNPATEECQQHGAGQGYGCKGSKSEERRHIWNGQHNRAGNTHGVLQTAVDYNDIRKGCLSYPERQGQHKTMIHPIISILILFLILLSTTSSTGSTLLNQCYKQSTCSFAGMRVLCWSTLC